MRPPLMGRRSPWRALGTVLGSVFLARGIGVGRLSPAGHLMVSLLSSLFDFFTPVGPRGLAYS